MKDMGVVIDRKWVKAINDRGECLMDYLRDSRKSLTRDFNLDSCISLRFYQNKRIYFDEVPVWTLDHRERSVVFWEKYVKRDTIEKLEKK